MPTTSKRRVSGTLVGGVVAGTFGLVAPFWFAVAFLTVLFFAALAMTKSGPRDAPRWV